MIDAEFQNDVRAAICQLAGIGDIGELSDGYHTFNSLYYQRMVLFAALVKAYKQKAWKSWRHEDGKLCFDGGWFIVGIDTPEGPYTYHYEAKYWHMFDCMELPSAPHWDGHTEKDVTRLLSLGEEITTGLNTISFWPRPMVDPWTPDDIDPEKFPATVNPEQFPATVNPEQFPMTVGSPVPVEEQPWWAKIKEWDEEVIEKLSEKYGKK